MNKNSYNKVIIIGRLGGPPEGRQTQTGRTTSSFSVATNESWKQHDGTFSEHTEWHTVVAWDRLADFSNDHLYKGQLVTIEGHLRTRSWVSGGEKHKKVEIVCSNVVPLEWKHKKTKK